jgi:hypothetical protein
VEREISSTIKKTAPIVIINRAVLNGFGEVSVAITKANSIAGIEIAARDTIAIMLLLNPTLSRLTPRKPK